MRYLTAMFLLLLCPAAWAQTQISVGVSTPGLSIGINMPSYPDLVLVPDMPVYYDPHVDANYFFYDGLYWVYEGDEWYASNWYNGPWGYVDRYDVPLFLLRVPVRYYRQRPSYFGGWRHDAPPRWGDRWGNDWQRQRQGWDRWDRSSAPRPAPLPSYQRSYSRDRYPRAPAQQRVIESQSYHYQPRESVKPQYVRPAGSSTQPARATPHTNQAAQQPQRADRPTQQQQRTEQRPGNQAQRSGSQRDVSHGKSRDDRGGKQGNKASGQGGAADKGNRGKRDDKGGK
jgi:hypothetical protein